MLEPTPTSASPRPSHTKAPKHDDPPLIADRPKTAPSVPSSGPKHARTHPDAHQGAANVKPHPSTPSPTKPPVHHDSDVPSAHSPEVEALIERAKATRADHTWHHNESLTQGRNAHRTNLPDEMREGIDGDFNWFEGDLRNNSHKQPTLSHDADTVDQGLSLDDWMAIGKASRRGLKIDVKEPAAMPAAIGALKHSGIPQERLMLNVGADDIAAAGGARHIRHQLPGAWMALNPGTNESGHYDASTLKPVIEQAKQMGGRIAFELRWDIADDKTIQALKPYGKVSVWTAKSEGTPDDPEAERHRLIARGVDGIIDLGEPSPWYQKLFQHAKDLTQTAAGRHLIQWGKDGIAIAKAGAHLVTDELHHGIDIASAGLSAAKDGAGHVISTIGDGIGSIGDGLSSVGLGNPFD
jgi:hypothetical protein